MCDRYAFRLLIKSVSAISGRDIMVVKLLLFFVFFFCVFEVFFVCGFHLFLVFCFFWFGCLHVAVFVFCLPSANFSNIPLGSFKIRININ